MALTPFVADTPAAPDESGSTFDNIKSQWNSFLSKPEGQAALLSFGINMLQPPSFGDNPLAQAGRALGHAGQTVGNIEAMDIKKQEASSKEDLRAAQADKASLAALAQGQAAQTAQAKLGLTQLGLQLQSAKAIYGAYGAYVKAWQAQKNAFILDPKMDPGPQKSLEEYTASNPTLAGSGAA